MHLINFEHKWIFIFKILKIRAMKNNIFMQSVQISKGVVLHESFFVTKAHQTCYYKCGEN